MIHIYTVSLIVLLFVFICQVVWVYKTRIKEEEDLLRKLSPFECQDLSPFVGLMVFNSKMYQELWESIGQTPGLFRMCMNAGRILSALRFLAKKYPYGIRTGQTWDELALVHRKELGIKDQKAMIREAICDTWILRWMALCAIPEITLNCIPYIKYPRMHALEAAKHYSNLVSSIETHYAYFCPELLPKLTQVL
jgi:hypothetical protein